MKKTVSAVLVLILILGLAACKPAGSSTDNSTPSGSASQASDSQGTADNQSAVNPGGSSGSAGNAEDAKLSGKLIGIPNDRTDMPVLTGISFSGNRVGSEAFNNKPAATEGIRCIFELNEYFMCTPETDTTYGIRVYILKHRDDQEYYETAQYSDLMPGFVNLYYLDYNSDDKCWDAEIYLNPDEVDPGYYDFIFTYEKTPFAKLITRFYAEGELENKSDDELEKLMTE